MTTPINMALYHQLVKLGAPPEEAEAAARTDTTDLVTKADLAALETRLTWRLVGLTALQLAAISALKVLS